MNTESEQELDEMPVSRHQDTETKIFTAPLPGQSLYEATGEALVKFTSTPSASWDPL